MCCVSSGRAEMRFAPTTNHPYRRRPHQRDLPENQYSYRPPPQPHPAIQPASQPPLPHLLSTLRTPFRHSRVPIPILGSQLQPARPSAPDTPPARFSFCHSNPQACILPSRHSLLPFYSGSSFARSFPPPSPSTLSLSLPPSSSSSGSRLARSPAPVRPIPRRPPTCHEARSFSLGWRCRLGQPPLLAERPSEAAGYPGEYKDETRPMEMAARAASAHLAPADVAEDEEGPGEVETRGSLRDEHSG